MLMKTIAVLFSFFLITTHPCFGQDSVARRERERAHDHFIGVQLNELVRQVISDDITAGLKANPYLLTYAVNSKNTNFGWRWGIGIQTHKLRTGSDGTFFAFDTVSRLFSLQLRGGVMWSKKVYKNFVAGLGIDQVGNYHYERIKVLESSGSHFSRMEHTAEVLTFGGGPVVSLRYDFPKSITLGTEASFYYMAGTSSIKGTFSGTSTNNGSKQKISDGTFNSPAVLYLIIRI
jgi:hypothetical protein